MKEIKDVSPSVLVFIVTASDDGETTVEALTDRARMHLKKRNGSNGAPAEEQALPEAQHPAVASNPRIKEALRYIDAHYRNDIRLDAVAAAAGMSPSHFSRTFKKVIGLSYQGYLNDRRIEKAKKLLRTTHRSIAEIADFLGFADATGFGRIFKKLTGRTPSAYRSRSAERFVPKKA